MPFGVWSLPGPSWGSGFRVWVWYGFWIRILIRTTKKVLVVFKLGLRACDFRGSGFRVRSLRGDLGLTASELRNQDLEFRAGSSGLGFIGFESDSAQMLWSFQAYRAEFRVSFLWLLILNLNAKPNLGYSSNGC